MTEIAEKKQHPFVDINEDYRITTDSSRNIILQKKYQQRNGKGKNAPLIDSYAFKDISYHGSSISSLARTLNNAELLESFDSIKVDSNVIEALEDMKKWLDEREQRIYTYFNEKIELQLANTKGKVADE